MNKLKRILIVDDEAKLRNVYKRSISSLGISVIEASDVWEATDALIREPIDLILLDIRMPEIDGREMFDVIREQAPQIKVIMMSIYSEEEQKQIVPEARHYFDKSKGSSHLMDRINTLLF